MILREYELRDRNGFVHFDNLNLTEVARLVEIQVLPVVKKHPVLDPEVASQTSKLVVDSEANWGWVERRAPNEVFHMGASESWLELEMARDAAAIALKPELFAIAVCAEMSGDALSARSHSEGLRALAAANPKLAPPRKVLEFSPFGKLSRYLYEPKVFKDDDFYATLENVARWYIAISELYCLTVLNQGRASE